VSHGPGWSTRSTATAAKREPAGRRPASQEITGCMHHQKTLILDEISMRELQKSKETRCPSMNILPTASKYHFFPARCPRSRCRLLLDCLHQRSKEHVAVAVQGMVCGRGSGVLTDDQGAKYSSARRCRQMWHTYGCVRLGK
jgi:hypothetical protein